jgi:phosphate-selective porin OprO/OprP
LKPLRNCLPEWNGCQQIACVILLALALQGNGRPARSQEPPTPPAPNPPTSTEDAVEARLRKLEEINERVLRENAELRDQVRALTDRISQPEQDGADNGTEGTPPIGDPSDLSSGPNVEPELDIRGSDTSGEAEESAAKRRKNPLFGDFDKGFIFETEDEEFVLRFSNETQVETRIFQQANQTFAHDQIDIPRQIWGFGGRITKPIEYFVSINKGLGSIDLRDAYLNFHYDDRLMLRFGRYRVPYTYEFYALSNVDLLAPERSVFTINYGLNRQIGLQAWGEVFDQRLDYAVGIFNGNRNGFEDTGDDKDVIAFLSARPFEKSTRWPFLHHLNIGGSLDYGKQSNSLQPQVLRTAINASTSEGSASASPAFLAFNNNITEEGPRELWNLHMAYFYKSLSLLAEWDSGFVTYAKGNSTTRTPLPVSGYYVQAGYVLTGETLEKRVVIDPKRPFDLRRGKFGPGAWEIHGRFAQMEVGNQVFTAGLSDPNLWSRNAGVIDVGMNWYLNRYLKIYFDWQHSMFGQPVFYRPGGYETTADLFWLRCQLYF